MRLRRDGDSGTGDHMHGEERDDGDIDGGGGEEEGRWTGGGMSAVGSSASADNKSGAVDEEIAAEVLAEEEGEDGFGVAVPPLGPTLPSFPLPCLERGDHHCRRLLFDRSTSF